MTWSMKMLGTIMMPKRECKGFKRAHCIIIYGVIDQGMEYSVPGLRAAYVCLLAEVMSLLGDIPFRTVSLQSFSALLQY